MVQKTFRLVKPNAQLTVPGTTYGQIIYFCLYGVDNQNK